MAKDKSTAKPYEKSYTLVIAVSFVIAVMMPFVRAVARGENEVAAAAYATVPPGSASTPSPLGGADVSDDFSLLAVGAFLLGLGFVLRRVA